jgi:hypothetical protein
MKNIIRTLMSIVASPKLIARFQDGESALATLAREAIQTNPESSVESQTTLRRAVREAAAPYSDADD